MFGFEKRNKVIGGRGRRHVNWMDRFFKSVCPLRRLVTLPFSLRGCFFTENLFLALDRNDSFIVEPSNDVLYQLSGSGIRLVEIEYLLNKNSIAITRFVTVASHFA